MAVAHNIVLQSTDITAHAEVNAIREACRSANDIFLESAVVATTCEPCPMCMSALHWARVGVVYFGATIDDAESAGFNELQVPASKIVEMGGSSVKLVGSLLADECRGLFEHWKANPDRRAY